MKSSIVTRLVAIIAVGMMGLWLAGCPANNDQNNNQPGQPGGKQQQQQQQQNSGMRVPGQSKKQNHNDQFGAGQNSQGNLGAGNQ